MHLDLSSERNLYRTMRPHIGHRIVCVCYGTDGKNPVNIAIECETCGEVLLDACDIAGEVYAMTDHLAESRKLHRQAFDAVWHEVGTSKDYLKRVIEYYIDRDLAELREILQELEGDTP